MRGPHNIWRLIRTGATLERTGAMGVVLDAFQAPRSLRIAARVNGETRQDSHTSDLLFPATRLVSYLSQAITLLPGDVIITGTPSGVGPVVPGDVVDIDIEGIGVLTNPVVAEKAA